MNLNPNDYGAPDRSQTFKLAMEKMKAAGGETIVETGCFWGLPSQGQSSFHFAMCADAINGSHLAIQRNPEHAEVSRELFTQFHRSTVVVADSVVWLSAPTTIFTDTIDLLYLDSLDYEAHDPLACQVHALAEMGACIGKMAERSLVLIDDYNFGKDGGGKAPLVIEFLKRRGWPCLLADYQILFQSPNYENIDRPQT